MGDRNNPIKFGPEWLRNLARERSAATSGPNSQNAGPGPNGGASPGVAGPSGGNTGSSSSGNNGNNNQNAPKVQLAKLRQYNAHTVRPPPVTRRYYSTRQTRQWHGHNYGRYGREEMLALYDRNTEAPPELKVIDVLYQSRGKPPSALANTFEEDSRDNARSAPTVGGLSPGDRFGVGRGMGRGVGLSEGRGRARGSYLRQLSLGRGTNWNAGAPRMPMYGGSADDESATNIRSWNNSNTQNNVNNRNTGDQTEWQSNKTFRNKRPGPHTNWRQSTRDDGDEWRSDTARSRHQDKWERDWGDRPPHEKPSWNSNRRTWVGGDTQNTEENLPEWAVENAEACGGTFDSSGAFHGYSNDDSNLPKPQESAYALTRSHTHGSVVRQKTAEEGSEEWWASEKAKKLSPKRFDAGDIKFKKTPTTSTSESGPSTSNQKEAGNKDDVPETPEQEEKADEQSESFSGADVDKTVIQKQGAIQKPKFPEGKTFDALMRSDINIEENRDERGNFQSVMIAPNNSLRQKHQNMVPPIIEPMNKQGRRPGMLRIRPAGGQIDVPDKSHNTLEDKLVEEMFDMALEDKEIMPKVPTPTSNPMMNQASPPSLVLSANAFSRAPMPNQMPMGMGNVVHPVHGMSMNQNNKMTMPAPGIQSPGMQPVGITNSALNASLGLPLGGPNMGMPLQGVPPPVMPNSGMTNPGMRTSPMQGTMSSAMQAAATAFQANPAMAALTANVGNNSLFMRQNSNNAAQLQSNEMQMPNHGGQNNMFPMHGLQHSGSQGGFGNSIYSNLMQQSAAQPPSTAHNLADQWYYEDPKKIIQGPFLSKEMYNWYRAGFFSPSLMVRRACDTMMRPLGSYGPIVPFAQMDMMPFPMPNNSHDNMMNSPQSLALDMMNMPNLNMSEGASVDGLQFGSVGIMRNPSYGQTQSQTQMVDSLWSQPSSTSDIMWMQHNINTRNENRVNNLPMFFWDTQPSGMASNSLLPEGLPKEMKTEEQILAQLRATQNIGSPQSLAFLPDPPTIPVITTKPDDSFASNANATPNLEELHKLIQKDPLVASPPVSESCENSDQVKPEKSPKSELNMEPKLVKQQPVATKPAEAKPPKQTKSETDKTTKSKEKNNTKTKNKKVKEEETVEVKVKEKEEEVKVEKRSAESSPSKTKKEDKVNKKELEKEKKEWIKEGFTVVKGSEKNVKDTKKKMDEAKATEEADRKRKEEEKVAAEEDRKRKQIEAFKKQQEQIQQQQQRQSAEFIMKKAPWSASNQMMQTTNKDGLTLAEIQRLEREKKLEQMKEQQHMMQLIAEQQAVALAREQARQEMQAGLGWAKKKVTITSTSGQSLSEIQAEARKQAVAAAAAAAAAAQALEEIPVILPPITNHVPWGNSQNGGGFWDAPTTPAPKPEKPQEVPKTPEIIKIKKKVTVQTPVKKETSPAADFENWCTGVLSSWSSKIDVPTFVGFLKDIESPYEVKDYVKCYLGETKESSDFARQFLERRSKLLRVGMVTPSDDLCSPAMAINPRPAPSTEYQEVKGKGKKTKKNKMLKVDARILGFSVTASEDRINVGDIDTV